MPSSRRPPLHHPETPELELVLVLHALADPTRLAIVETLTREPERACGTFPVEVAPSTMTHHFRVLREAGVIRQREDGNRRWNALRAADLDERFPGLLAAVLQSAGAAPRSAGAGPAPRSAGAGAGAAPRSADAGAAPRSAETAVS